MSVQTGVCKRLGEWVHGFRLQYVTMCTSVPYVVKEPLLSLGLCRVDVR